MRRILFICLAAVTVFRAELTSAQQSARGFSPLSLTATAQSVDAPPNITQLWSSAGSTSDARLGAHALRLIGDLDGDGIADVAAAQQLQISAPAPVPGGMVTDTVGSVRILSGASGAVIGTIRYDSAENFGTSVVSVGDINGDGIDDVAVGAPGEASVDPAIVSGAVLLFSGADFSLLGRIDGPVGLRQFGFALQAADVNGDGVRDLISSNGHQIAAVSVTDGNANVLWTNGPTVDVVIFLKTDVLKAVGDVDGDGVVDFGLMNPLTDPVAGVYGEVVVVSGDDGSTLTTISGSSTLIAGQELAGIGDLNGDGFDDVAHIAVDGALYSDAPTEISHRLTVLSGPNFFPLYSTEVAVGPLLLGDLEVAGDLDGDGITDLWASSAISYESASQPGFDLATSGTTFRGEVVALSGVDGRELYRVAAPSSLTMPAGFGTNLAEGADLNSDGRNDLVVAAPLETVGPDEKAGRIYSLSVQEASPQIQTTWRISLTPFELNGQIYADGPVSPATIFLPADGIPVMVMADDTVVPADGISNYSIALVTASDSTGLSGPYLTVVTPLDAATIAANPMVASLDAYLPDVLIANGPYADYSVNLPTTGTSIADLLAQLASFADAFGPLSRAWSAFVQGIERQIDRGRLDRAQNMIALARWLVTGPFSRWLDADDIADITDTLDQLANALTQ